MSQKTFYIFIIFIFLSLYGYSQTIPLDGRWEVKLDSLDIGKERNWFREFSGPYVNLPGTLDDAGIGEQIVLDTLDLNKTVLMSLTRKHRYIGAAWYKRQIEIKKGYPRAELFLERVIWKTECWLDGVYMGSAESLSAAHRFQLGDLRAGIHTIILRVDNSRQHDISFNNFAHAYTDGTQVIWNGVIGQIKINDAARNTLKDLQVYPDSDQNSIDVKLAIENQVKYQKGRIRYSVFDGTKLVSVKVSEVKGNTSGNLITNKILVNNAKSWNEFDPILYQLRVELLNGAGKVIADATSKFGFRKLGNQDGQLVLNGKRIFLRGTLDCNIYPIAGHPPMDKAGWIKVFNTVKEYGLNHVRYHSWCPPEAAFQVADSLGLYLQVELPLWSVKVGQDRATLAFLENEAKAIIASYGNHPSFCFWSLGNELEGDFGWLNDMVAKLKKADNRRFYTATTFSFQQGHGLAPEPNDDFFITQYTKNGWIRGQGIFNAEAPNFDKDYSKNAEGLNVPLISHEIGQYSVFPNLGEIGKYQGVLNPLNLKAIRYDLQKKGLFALADSFKLSSGKFAALLYKEEIERALKTPALSGFQLLGLQDFPGQGTALVGVLDSFWENKGLMSSNEFRRFSAEVVPLLNYKKASYLNHENFEGEIMLGNFGRGKIIGSAIWKVIDQKGEVLYSGQTPAKALDLGTSVLGKVLFALGKIKKASQLTFEVQLANTSYRNSWNFWVYPTVQPTVGTEMLFTNSKQEAYAALRLGKTVILNPDTAAINGITGRFTSVFWSPVHFPDQPGSMGILTNPLHPALSGFPTNFYSNWQWWDLITHSKSLVLDDIADQQNPIVRVIDKFTMNRKLGTLLEARVDKGKLLLCTMDITKRLEERIEARQLRNSLTSYAQCNDFSPRSNLTFAEIDKWIK